ncbi:hypothetical protein [Desulforamulus ruminis]|uniref:Uncharacterized protein n=1 Tax=Desulforamulus ruminis (strain ATCC 23193 / DSM 2154 / NCIMB 8452 / DL) TaxID=696281 RepID=F6DM22_DESRL|nr:hypothetical protein [Desulforamulus ruminis]AEG59364.1 hypothetical protein Desru_1089 [Desulforamulus ruminis DSM 2154]
MVDLIVILIAFLFGALSAVFCVRLGLTWARIQRGEEPKHLPILPETKPPPKVEEQEPKPDKTLQHWFVGGEEKP